MGDTSIEWTDKVWNPIRGCDKVSQGCSNCYAATMAARFTKPGQAYEGLAYRDSAGRAQWTGKIRLVEERLMDPIRWRKPRRIFVNSMSDLFHPMVPTDYIARIFAVMAIAQRHTFQILTKRPERMAQLMDDDQFIGATYRHAQRIGGNGVVAGTWPLPNVWLGASVENQETANERIPHLRRSQAAVRFLSCEPLLGPISFKPQTDVMEVKPNLDGIHWVIVGGESGHHHRPMDLAWARQIRNECQDAGVAMFFKQVGGRTPKAGGDQLDGAVIQEYPKAVA